VVVVGNGMVGQRFLQRLAERGLTRRLRVTPFGEEPRPAYDRVKLSSWFDHRDADALSMVEPGFYDESGIDVRIGDEVVAIDRVRQVVSPASGDEIAYDRLVLATGSRPFVPPVPGADRSGVFVYRTIDDLEAIDAWARRPDVRSGVVVGGGLLGLEAANALRLLGLDTHVVEFAPQLMP